jgi:condensin complex subunit 2
MKLSGLDWQGASTGIDSLSKIYGFKVDKTHRDTYKILGSLNRTEIKDDDESIAIKKFKKLFFEDLT